MKNPGELFNLVKFHLQLERRKSLRVKISHPYSFFPKISYEGLPLEIEDISVTGLCIKNFFDQKLLDTHINVDIEWLDANFKVRFLVVEQNERILRLMHDEFSPKLTLRLDYTLRPGQLGVLFRKKHSSKIEQWLGPVGEKIEFIEDADLLARIDLFDTQFACSADGLLTYFKDTKTSEIQVFKGQKIQDPKILEKIIFALDNITSPTPSIETLKKFVIRQAYGEQIELKVAS